MKAEELRIGNYVESFRGIYPIVGITSVKEKTYSLMNYPFAEFENKPPIAIYRLNPILLTEDWILRVLKQENSEADNTFVYNFSRDINGYFIWISGFKRYIKWVHEYQNLYFALTGNELQIGEARTEGAF